MTAAALHPFTAKYDGTCGTCPTPIDRGDEVFYPWPGAEHVSGLACCGDRPVEELLPRQHGEQPLDDDPTVDVAQVLPRGRTRADMCGVCWQIRSSNNTCGCP